MPPDSDAAPGHLKRLAGKWSLTVHSRYKFGSIGLAMVMAMSLSESASAVTVEVAQACNALMTKSFPPRQVGNPAAGSVKGSAKDQREFFKK
jgi:hypothetical protein